MLNNELLNKNKNGPFISLSNLNDDQMRHANSGDWWKTETQRAFESPEQFVQSFPKFQKSLGKITTSSMYFEMSAQAKVGNTLVSLSSLIYRNPKDGKISILKRDFGKLFTSKIQIETEILSI